MVTLVSTSLRQAKCWTVISEEYCEWTGWFLLFPTKVKKTAREMLLSSDSSSLYWLSVKSDIRVELQMDWLNRNSLHACCPAFGILPLEFWLLSAQMFYLTVFINLSSSILHVYNGLLVLKIVSSVNLIYSNWNICIYRHVLLC